MKSKDVIKSELEGAIVIARYGNYRTYEIKEVDFNSSPLSKFIPRNQEESITYK